MPATTLRFAFDIRRTPASVKRWWTDLPDDYRAQDPREQPHRIEVLRRTPDGTVVRSTWRGPGGSEFQSDETLRVGPDGTWTFDIAGFMGLHVRDEFVALPTKDGTRLEITSTLTGRGLRGRLALPLVSRIARKNFGRTWRDAAILCERDAP